MTSFKQLDLYAPIQRAIVEQKYETPTPIQAKAIPPAIEGLDILGCAQTGTGKTAAFSLPILDFLGHERPKRERNRPTVLVLAPTRELAIQINQSFAVYGKHMNFAQALVYGGVNQNPQVSQLRKGVDVLVATPGRLLDLMEQGHIDLRNVEIFVLDEADRMLDMGFLPELKRIIAKLPKERQSLFFSATMPKKIVELSKRLLFNPVSIHISPETPNIDLIEQSIEMMENGDKFHSLQSLLGDGAVKSAIVFTRTKHRANQLTRKLEKAGVSASAIHGNKSQSARQKALESFRNGKIKVLVATDVAARGIDIDGVTHVVNFDIPVDPESYVHRIGRTGRAGADGIAVTYCTPSERTELRAIEQLMGKRLEVTRKQASRKQASRNEPEKRVRKNQSTGNKKSRPAAEFRPRRKKSGGKARQPNMSAAS